MANKYFISPISQLRNILVSMTVEHAMSMQATSIEVYNMLYGDGKYETQAGGQDINDVEAAEEILNEKDENIKFCLVSHQQWYLTVAGVSKIYHIRTQNPYNDDIVHLKKDRPCNRVASTLLHTAKELKGMTEAYDRFMKDSSILNFHISEYDIKSLSTAELKELATKILRNLKTIGMTNLYFDSLRKAVNERLKKVFAKNPFNIELMVLNGRLLSKMYYEHKQCA